MITNNGKLQIGRFFAQYDPTIAEAIVFGIGTATEDADDISLNLEIGRAEIDVIGYDFVANKLTFKGTVPDTYAGKIYEVGLFTKIADGTSGTFGSRNITTCDSSTESWVTVPGGSAATFDSTNTRIGADSILLNPTTTNTQVVGQSNIGLDFSENSGADSFLFAFNATNGFASAVSVLFLTDSSNYFTFALGSQTSGYKIIEKTLSTATATGAPDWGNITEVRISVAATGGTAGIEFDAIRLEDRDTADDDYFIVARKVLGSPLTIVAGQPQDIEYSMALTVT